MSDLPRGDQVSGDEAFFYRRRSLDEVAAIEREGLRLLAEAQVARQQWLAAHARMKRVQREIHRSGEGTPADQADQANHRLRAEQESHERSRSALEREQAHGQSLEAEVLAIQDQERARLARDLHDGIAQNLVAASLMLGMHLRQLTESDPGSGAVSSGRKVGEILDLTIQEMRGLAHELGGIGVGAQGEKLCEAFHTLAGRLNGSGNVRCVVACPDAPSLGGDHAGHLYRIVQEAVGNALRHGQAEHVEICLAQVEGQWRLTVADDGLGVPEGGPPSGGLGMRSMTYRATVLGGTLTVRRARPSGERPGTVVLCEFP